MKEEINFLRKNNYMIRPKIIQMEVTRACPLSCPQCYKNLEGQMHMDKEVLQKLLQQYADIAPCALMINGGEPLLYPYFEELITYCSEKRISCYVYSSGYGIENISIKTLKRVNIDISLNGSSQEINELSRDGYEVALAAMRFLSDSNVEFGITWVARHDNIDDLPNMFELARNRGAKHIQIIGNKVNSYGTLVSELERTDYEKLIRYIHAYEEQENIVEVHRQQCFSFLHVAEGTGYVPLSNGCMAGILSCAVDLYGHFLPCMHINVSENATSLMEYWHKSQILNDIRTTQYNEIEECIGCKHIEYCHFCRASFANSGVDLQKGPKNCCLKE